MVYALRHFQCLAKLLATHNCPPFSSADMCSFYVVLRLMEIECVQRFGMGLMSLPMFPQTFVYFDWAQDTIKSN